MCEVEPRLNEVLGQLSAIVAPRKEPSSTICELVQTVRAAIQCTTERSVGSSANLLDDWEFIAG